MLDKVLKKCRIKEIIGVEKFDNTKILIGTDDELPDDITLENVVISITTFSEWFKPNKLSLNEGKTKFTLFHKLRDKDNLPLQLPNLKIIMK